MLPEPDRLLSGIEEVPPETAQGGQTRVVGFSATRDICLISSTSGQEAPKHLPWRQQR